MPVQAFSWFGLIMRKNDRTRAVIIRHLTGGVRDAMDVQGRPPGYEDEHLLAVAPALNEHDLAAVIERLEGAGLRKGRDFIATAPPHGVNGPRPLWLSSMLEPTGNPPELEATMDPEVREMWERSRKTLYFITPGYEQDEE